MGVFSSRRLVAAALLFACTPALPAQAVERVTIDARAPTTPFPHFWEKTFGSGRAILSLRESYRKDLDAVHAVTNFESIRFHGILMDEVGLYDPDRQTKNPGQTAVAANDASVYNFSYIDQIYDGLLDHHVRPFVEISFMPKRMASDPAALHAFWYKPNVSPPKDYKLWDAMIAAFAKHLVDRYGIAEVATWKFEVWNEPNIDFWVGEPKQATYFQLYDHTARALKSVSTRLQIGGPATAQAAWVTPFLEHVKSANVPVDFVSTHVYGNEASKDVFGTEETIGRDKMVWRSVKKVHEEIARSPFPHIPLIFSEYGASYANEPNVSDSTYMGPWLANNIRLCDGLTESMAYWDFSDVFEEQGVVRTPFYGGFGLVAADAIPKPALHAFAMLHHLGDRRIAVTSESMLATRTATGLALALWNYAPPIGTGGEYTVPHGPAGQAKDFELTFEKIATDARVEIWRVDDDHGNALKRFDEMGRPANLSKDQMMKLQQAGTMSPAERMTLKDGKIKVSVPAHGLVLLVLAP